MILRLVIKEAIALIFIVTVMVSYSPSGDPYHNDVMGIDTIEG